MIEKITLGIADESGNFIAVKQTGDQAKIKIDVAIADLINEINCRNNSITDTEIQTAEKFHFALTLQNYLREIKNNGIIN